MAANFVVIPPAVPLVVDVVTFSGDYNDPDNQQFDHFVCPVIGVKVWEDCTDVLFVLHGNIVELEEFQGDHAIDDWSAARLRVAAKEFTDAYLDDLKKEAIWACQEYERQDCEMIKEALRSKAEAN